MCGIAGIFAYHYAALEVNPEELRLIRDRMANRGPDGAGEWYSEDGRVGLAHRRLAIIDLSEAATQPMVSEDGALVVSFNGEIYNYKELRAELIAKGRAFRTNSDTEVLLHLYAEKGEAMVHDLRGMFAFVLWDTKKQTLLLARDSYGIKPLYYADDGWTVRIASQVKALLTSEKVSRLPEPAGIVGFYLFGSVPEPYTTYQEIRQVPAGSIVTVDQIGPSVPKPYFSIAKVFRDADDSDSHCEEAGRPTKQSRRLLRPRHWLRQCRGLAMTEKNGPSLRGVWLNGEERRSNPRSLIHDALLDSVRHHFVSDVPVGIFLSSGVDSGSLVSLAREIGIEDLRTITLAFEEFKGTDQDEVPLAEGVARHFGTKHTTCVVSKEEFQNDLPKILEAMDQPTIDGVNTYFVAKAAAEQGLKVALSGLGGDELFGGYPSFWQIPMLVRAMAIPSRIPFAGDAFRWMLGSGIASSPPPAAPRNDVSLPAKPFAICHKPFATSPKYAGLLKYGGSYAGAYFLRRGLFMPWELTSVLDRDTAIEGLRRLRPLKHIQSQLQPDPKTPFGRVAALEASLYLRNQLLRDSDWSGMAHSVEIRTPFVDTPLLKAVSSIRISQAKDQNGKKNARFDGKGMLAGCLDRPLPQAIVSRPKRAFLVPFDAWLERQDDGDQPGPRRWARLVTRPFNAEASYIPAS